MNQVQAWRVAHLTAKAAAQAEVVVIARVALVVMFLAWWVPALVNGTLGAWWRHVLAWLGCCVLCSAVDGPTRTTLEQIKQARGIPGGTLPPFSSN